MILKTELNYTAAADCFRRLRTKQFDWERLGGLAFNALFIVVGIYAAVKYGPGYMGAAYQIIKEIFSK